MFNKSNLDYFKEAAWQPEDWLQRSRPLAFPWPARGAETTCAAPEGKAGLVTPEPGLQICAGAWGCRSIRRPDPGEKPAVVLASPSQRCMFIEALPAPAQAPRSLRKRPRGLSWSQSHPSLGYLHMCWKACTHKRETSSFSELIQNFSNGKKKN